MSEIVYIMAVAEYLLDCGDADVEFGDGVGMSQMTMRWWTALCCNMNNQFAPRRTMGFQAKLYKLYTKMIWIPKPMNISLRTLFRHNSGFNLLK